MGKGINPKKEYTTVKSKETVERLLALQAATGTDKLQTEINRELMKRIRGLEKQVSARTILERVLETIDKTIGKMEKELAPKPKPKGLEAVGISYRGDTVHLPREIIAEIEEAVGRGIKSSNRPTPLKGPIERPKGAPPL